MLLKLSESPIDVLRIYFNRDQADFYFKRMIVLPILERKFIFTDNDNINPKTYLSENLPCLSGS